MNGLELKVEKAMDEESVKEIISEDVSENKIEQTLNYDMLTKDEWLKYFAEQFNKHLCPEMNGRVYNQLRDRGTPTWDTIARYTGDITVPTVNITN